VGFRVDLLRSRLPLVQFRAVITLFRGRIVESVMPDKPPIVVEPRYHNLFDGVTETDRPDVDVRRPEDPITELESPDDPVVLVSFSRT
jgi:hypothetical protein